MNEVNAINLNVAVVENVAEMESVDGSATSGRPLIEVIDEGQVDLSSDGIESRTLLPLHLSPISSPILPPTLLMLWMRVTALSFPSYVLSSFSSPTFLSSWVSL